MGVDLININEIMQIAITPVFLLVGIGSLLLTMTNRLGRIKDRVRYLRSISLDYDQSVEGRAFKQAWSRLISRSKFCYASIAFATTSALFVCFVILCIFIQEFYELDAPQVVAVLFMACIVFLVFSLFFLVIEIFLATRSTHKEGEDVESIIHKLEQSAHP